VTTSVRCQGRGYIDFVARRRDIERLQSEVEELFADLWQLPRFTGARQGFRPQVDCFRHAERAELVVVVELPGVDPADLRLVLEGRELLVAGERKRPPAAGSSWQLMEIEYGPFERRIALGADVDTDGAAAGYDRGLLTVVFPLAARRARPAKARIAVRTTR